MMSSVTSSQPVSFRNKFLRYAVVFGPRKSELCPVEEDPMAKRRGRGRRIVLSSRRVCVLLFLKLIFWSISWFSKKEKRQQRMLEAGMVRPTQPVFSGATLPSNYNTQYWQPAVQTFSATVPPVHTYTHETVTETGTGKQGLPHPTKKLLEPTE